MLPELAYHAWQLSALSCCWNHLNSAGHKGRALPPATLSEFTWTWMTFQHFQNSPPGNSNKKPRLKTPTGLSKWFQILFDVFKFYLIRQNHLDQRHKALDRYTERKWPALRPMVMVKFNIEQATRIVILSHGKGHPWCEFESENGHQWGDIPSMRGAVIEG